MWVHKVDNGAMNKNIKETQRQVLISTTGAYRISHFQALCVISNSQPIHIKLKEIQELYKRARGLVNETKAQIRTRSKEKPKVPPPPHKQSGPRTLGSPTNLSRWVSIYYREFGCVKCLVGFCMKPSVSWYMQLYYYIFRRA